MSTEPASQPGGRSLRERKKRATRDRIRHRAVGLFLERGFDAVSIAEIAEAAEVSKMTVFNYFPAKEDMLFAGNVTLFPDIAGAVRDRPDVPPLRAVREFVEAELGRRAEWTGLHDGVSQFARLFWASPTLLAALGRRWDGVREDLLAALAQAAGLPPDPLAGLDLASQQNHAGTADDAGLGPDGLMPRLVAQQVLAVIQTLTAANQWRQLAGLTADASAAQAHAETERAFDLLERGVGEWPIR